MTTTVGAFILNTKNELLVCHPTNGSIVKNWSIPKGLPENGEVYLETAIREVKEETNIDIVDENVKTIIWLGTIPYKTRKKELKAYLFRLTQPVEQILKCNSMVDNAFPENDLMLWLSVDQAESLLHEAQQQLIPELKKWM